MNIYKKSDSIFYEKHKELSGRKLTMDPSDYKYRVEYMEILKKEKKSQALHSSSLKQIKPKCSNSNPEEQSNSLSNSHCKAQSLSISKDKGKYTLVVPGTNLEWQKNKFIDLNIFEILAGPQDKPASINIVIDGLEGPCAESHQNNAFKINKSNYITPIINDANFKAKVSYFDIPCNNLFSAYAQILRLISGRNHLDYTINYGLCGFTKEVIIRVYPEIEAKASIELELKLELTKKGKSLEKDKDEESEDKLKDLIKYEFEVTYSDERVIYFSQNSKDDKKEFSFYQFVVAFLENYRYLQEGFSVFLSDSQKLEIIFSPKVQASLAFREVDGKPFVDAEYKIKLGLDPLFSMKGEADVSGALLSLVPALGAFVSALENVKLAEVFLGFKTDIKISLNNTFTKLAGEDWTDNNILFEATGLIKLEGSVKSEHHFWKVQYSVGSKIGAEGGFEIKDSKFEEDENGIYFPVKMNFLGITSYMQSWISLGCSEKRDSNPKAAGIMEMKFIGKDESEDTSKMSEPKKSIIVNPIEGIINHNFYI
jgi:hypothetical protein